MYLLDTNVISEMRKISSWKADKVFCAWLEGLDLRNLFTSAIVIEELEKGVLQTERRDPSTGILLRQWLDSQVLPTFSGRILTVDTVVARQSARLRVPDPRSIHNYLIAATAMVHGKIMVTRNVEDFASTGVRVINPWEKQIPA